MPATEEEVDAMRLKRVQKNDPDAADYLVPFLKRVIPYSEFAHIKNAHCWDFLLVKYTVFEAYPLLAPKCRVGQQLNILLHIFTTLLNTTKCRVGARSAVEEQTRQRQR
jgi:hypothetical protein